MVHASASIEKYVCVQEGISRLKARVSNLPSSMLVSSYLYGPTLKAPEARLLAAIAAEHSCPLLKTDTRQAFLYGEM
jgi:hypothetical protein